VTGDMEHRFKNLCATVSRPVLLPGRDFCLEGISVQ
jgi:hypothetical protein